MGGAQPQAPRLWSMSGGLKSPQAGSPRRDPDWRCQRIGARRARRQHARFDTVTGHNPESLTLKGIEQQRHLVPGDGPRVGVSAIRGCGWDWRRKGWWS